MKNDISDINEQDVSSSHMEYHQPGGIWIERRATSHHTLWDTRYSEAYTLVDDEHHPLHDECDQEYRFPSIAAAEARIRELLAPHLRALAQAYALESEGVA